MTEIRTISHSDLHLQRLNLGPETNLTHLEERSGTSGVERRTSAIVRRVATVLLIKLSARISSRGVEQYCLGGFGHELPTREAPQNWRRKGHCKRAENQW